MYKTIYSENNKKEKYIIYLDMDDVLTNFIQHYYNHFGVKLGWNIKGPSEDEIFSNIKSVPHWWLSMPWTQNGKYLLTKCRALCNNVELLTTPAYSVKTCEEDKINWVKKEIGDIKVNFSENKEEFANSKTILIDDKKENIERFTEAGGIGIFYDNIASVIKKLKNLFKEN